MDAVDICSLLMFHAFNHSSGSNELTAMDEAWEYSSRMTLRRLPIDEKRWVER